jgi:hypothetical protein
LAVLIGGTSASLAQSVDCSTGPGALQTAINALTANQTLTITGTCTLGPGAGSFSISAVSPVTLVAGVSGATIEGQISVFMPRVTLSGLTIDGSGITLAPPPVPNGGVIANGNGGAFVTITNCTIQNWSGNGVLVAAHAGVWINGGTITNNAGAGILVNGGTASLADAPGGTVGNPVTISSNGTGISILAGGGATVVNGSIENNTNDGVDVTDHSSIVFSTDGGAGTAITGNVDGVGVLANQGSHLTLGSGNVSNNGGGGISVQNGSNASIGANVTGGTPGTLTQITGNGITGSNQAGSGVGASGSTITITGATISGNLNGDNLKGAAVSLMGGTATIKNSSISSVSGLTAMSINVAELGLQGDTVTGPGNAPAMAVTGSKVGLSASTIADNDAIDPTILAADGSTLDSSGGNTICAGTLSGPACTPAGGVAITVANDSTFHQVTNNGTSAADKITGAGTVQVQSNMELGTGAAAPSTWTGAITVQQNSSFRLDGGISISGGVTILQGSNGFFNKSATGTNAATVTCAGTNSSHIAGASFVSPPVTLVTTGVGCYAF